MIQFQKATKHKSKLRAALFGPSGSGKTYSALRIARGLAGQQGRVALIDTEFGSAAKYADRFEFDTVRLDDNAGIDQMIECLVAAKDYDVVIIDSMTHTWDELKDEVQRLSRSAKFGGNYWAAWSEGTPKQKRFIKALLSFPGHVVATMRVRTHWDTETTQNGRVKPVRKGLDPEQGKGIEYEFDMLLELSTEHVAEVIKDRTGKFQDKTIEKPGEDFGKALAEWLADGAEPVAPSQPPAAGPDLTDLQRLIDEHGITADQAEAWCRHFKVTALADLTQTQVDAIVRRIEDKVKGEA
ncbi:MAG: ATP-binding protein [Planctomycetes bacterium]|nr:ATP-binding protein [Planctomycetota bacterium]